MVIDVFISPSGMPLSRVRMSPRWEIRNADLVRLHPPRERMIGIVAGLGREIEGDGQAGLTLARDCPAIERVRLLPRSNDRHRSGRSRACRSRSVLVPPSAVWAMLQCTQFRRHLTRAGVPVAKRFWISPMITQQDAQRQSSSA